MPRLAALATTAALALLVPAAARAGDAALRLEVGGGVDTNPLRLADRARGSDGFVSAVAAGSFATETGPLTLRGSLSEGARSYPSQQEANLVASRLELGLGGAVSRKLRLEGVVAFRDLTEQGGLRSETGGRAALEASLRAGSSRLGFSAAFEALTPRDDALEPYGWYGPAGAISITRPAGENQTVRAGFDFARRVFPRWDGPEGRDDDVLTASVEWMRRRPVILGVAYAFTADFSSVRGGDYRRHRLTARAAVTLPGDTTLAVQGSVQGSIYPAGFSTDQPVLLAQADSSQNALELRVSRPLNRRLELALTAAAYGSELSGGGAPRVEYEREVIQLGLSWRAPGRPEVPLPPPPRN